MLDRSELDMASGVIVVHLRTGVFAYIKGWASSPPCALSGVGLVGLVSDGAHFLGKPCLTRPGIVTTLRMAAWATFSVVLTHSVVRPFQGLWFLSVRSSYANTGLVSRRWSARWNRAPQSSELAGPVPRSRSSVQL